jgi:tetratricopeptide (TPR) repeat protein
MNLATLFLQSGQLDKAEGSVNQSLALGPDLRQVYASSKNVLGDVLTARDDLGGAQKEYEDALSRFTQMKDQPDIATSRVMLANVALEQGEFARAEELVRPAVEAFRAEKTPDDEASSRETLARILMAQGKNEQAVEEINAAKALPFQDKTIAVRVAITAARLSAWRGNPAEARQSLDKSLAELRRLNLAELQLEVRLAQAEIELRSDAASARVHLQSLEQDARAGGYLLVAAKALRLRQAR